MDELEAEFGWAEMGATGNAESQEIRFMITVQTWTFPHLSAYTINRAMKVIVTGSYNHNLVHGKAWERRPQGPLEF